MTFSVKELPGITDEYRLFQNYQNPFNPSTSICYALPERTVVRLTVYNILGQLVSTLVDKVQAEGYYEDIFDDPHNSSGTYIYRLQGGGYVENRKFFYLK